jgi:VanZ family protein
MQRWVVFAFWTLVIFWSMDITRPKEAEWVNSLQKFCAHHGFPECTPAKLYHCGSFALWSVLLAGALAQDYAKNLTRAQITVTLLALVGFAGIPEVFQNFNSARTPTWFDVGINISGGLLGLALQTLAARYAEHAPPAMPIEVKKA